MPTARRRLKNASKLGLRKLFEFGQHLGVDLLPRHFYSEIPVIHELRNTTHWKEPYSMMGVGGIDIQGQLQFVKDCCQARIITELKTRNIHAEACRRNGEDGFGPIEADLLFAFVASKRPKQILQIGCGVSTAVLNRPSCASHRARFIIG